MALLRALAGDREPDGRSAPPVDLEQLDTVQRGGSGAIEGAPVRDARAGGEGGPQGARRAGGESRGEARRAEAVRRRACDGRRPRRAQVQELVSISPDLVRRALGLRYAFWRCAIVRTTSHRGQTPGSRTAGRVRIEPEISGVAVVLLGDFNPAIFTPAWFAMHGLLPKAAADSADLQVAHRQVTAFSTDWLRLQVTSDRFAADTAQAPHIRVRDLVMRVFKEHLTHTPTRVMGINRTVHFRVGSLAERDRIGRALAPVEPWGRWGVELGLDGEHGGMTSLIMSQIRPEGRPPGGRINVKVEPSSRIGDGRGCPVRC